MARISNAQFLNRLVRFSWNWHRAEKGSAQQNKQRRTRVYEPEQRVRVYVYRLIKLQEK